MNITKDPIFRPIMFALVVGYIALISQALWAAKPGNDTAGLQDIQLTGFTSPAFDA